MKKPPFQKSMLHSVEGLLWILKSERNFKIHLIALVINIVLLIVLKVNSTDCALILGVCFLVLITEALNTCIEKICDFIQPEKDNRIKIIKDLGAGAVLLASICAIIIGSLVYYNYISTLFK